MLGLELIKYGSGPEIFGTETSAGTIYSAIVEQLPVHDDSANSLMTFSLSPSIMCHRVDTESHLGFDKSRLFKESLELWPSVEVRF